MTISLNIGKGLRFANHRLVTDTSNENDLIKVMADGLYVPDLSGKDGGAGGTSPDNVTIVETSNKKLKLNVDYVQLIYSMGYRVVSDRSSVTLKYSDALKDMKAIFTEMNTHASLNYTSYYFRKGDLFQLVTASIGAKPRGASYYMEDSNRYVPGNETKVLFVVDSASYSGYKCTKLTLTCLYVKEGEESNFVPKQTYSYP